MKPLASLVLVLVLVLSSAVFAAERPNVVYLMTDDQVDLATGCYGNREVRTPNMDRLAAEGVRFANHYNTTSICMASRAIVATGFYEYRTGCNFQHGPLSAADWARTYHTRFREAGYFTGFAGKFGFSVRRDGKGPENPGRQSDMPGDAFDRWAGGPGQTSYETAKNEGIARYAREYPHSSRAYGAWARDFIRDAKASGKPFLLSISFKAPHLPFTPDPALDDVYAGTTFTPPANYGTDHAKHLAPHARTGRQYKSYRFWIDDYQDSIRRYHQLIHGVDVAIGMLREALEEQGVAENTVIVFTSDNGYSCGAHGFGGKVLPYEEASRSPLIVFDPRLPREQRGTVRTDVTGNIDMAPTLLDLAGLTVPEGLDGISLVPLLRDPNAGERESIALFNMWGNPEIQAMSVVTPKWKYILWNHESGTLRPTEELFDLEHDRLELKNLAGDPKHAAVLAEMRRRYDAQLAHLKEHAVERNGYDRYKVLFDRDATAAEKRAVSPKTSGSGGRNRSF